MRGSSRGSIAVAIGGHLATCPRMVKAADALTAAGYGVRVVSTLDHSWASGFDPQIADGRSWRWTPVDLRRSRRPIDWYSQGLKRRTLRGLVRWLGVAPSRLPIGLLCVLGRRGIAGVIGQISREPADLVYAGTSAGLSVGPLAAHRLSVPFALDLEDFHSAELADSPVTAFDHGVAAALESRFLSKAAFLTAGSEGIARAYAARYDVIPIPIHNVFALPGQQPRLRPVADGPRRLYWFSQTIGLDRGLQDVVRALGMCAQPCHLYLQGNAPSGVEAHLRNLAEREAPRLTLRFSPLVSPDLIVPGLAAFDIGLALEQPVSFNRSICLTNKALTYILGGLPVVMTDTEGQRPLAQSLGEGALLYPPGDFMTLAGRLRAWLADDDALRRAGIAAWEAAKDRWHWEHPLEQGALLRAVHQALDDTPERV